MKSNSDSQSESTMSDQVNDAGLQSEQTIMNADETLINRGDQSYRPQFIGMNKIKNKIKNLIKITFKSILAYLIFVNDKFI